MDILVVVLCLSALMFVAYRGFSVIMFAPIVALAAVLIYQPISTLPAYTHLFMDKASFFFKMYFPIFLLGSIFGKVIEVSGFAKSLCSALYRLVGDRGVLIVITAIGAILAYGGVSAFVVVFAVYPFAVEMFRLGSIPKRLIPGAIWLGGSCFAPDSLPGSPQIQNIVPTFFFKTTAYSGPMLGIIDSIIVLGLSLLYLERQRRKAQAVHEPYDSGWVLVNEPAPFTDEHLPHPLIAIVPMIVVWILNYVFTAHMTQWFGPHFALSFPGLKSPIQIDVQAVTAVWAVELAVAAGIVTVILLAWKRILPRFAESSKQAVSGALLANINTASEFGYGSIIAVLPGFLMLSEAMKTAIPNPLVSEAVSVQVLAGIVGSASGGLSIALGAMADLFIQNAHTAGIPLEVMHRIASMASGGMDSLPHNGAVITMLAVTGLTHRQSYSNVFAITVIKTVTVFVMIGLYYMFGIV